MRGPHYRNLGPMRHISQNTLQPILYSPQTRQEAPVPPTCAKQAFTSETVLWLCKIFSEQMEREV